MCVCVFLRILRHFRLRFSRPNDQRQSLRVVIWLIWRFWAQKSQTTPTTSTKTMATNNNLLLLKCAISLYTFIAVVTMMMTWSDCRCATEKAQLLSFVIRISERNRCVHFSFSRWVLNKLAKATCESATDEDKIFSKSIYVCLAIKAGS